MVVAVTADPAKAEEAVERWADHVSSEELQEPGPLALNLLAAHVGERDAADAAITEAVRRARAAGQSWSQIAAVLGVTKQAAQRKYASRMTA